MQPSVWFVGTDMRVQLASLRSSTMATGTYLNNSTGVTAKVWRALSTASTADMVYSAALTATTAATGTYGLVVHSTDHQMPRRTVGMVVLTVRSGGFDREWRPVFRVDTGRY